MAYDGSRNFILILWDVMAQRVKALFMPNYEYPPEIAPQQDSGRFEVLSMNTISDSDKKGGKKNKKRKYIVEDDDE